MSVRDAAAWPLRLEALNLGVCASYDNVHSRIVKYVSEVLPEDEDAIAREVRATLSVVSPPSHPSVFRFLPSPLSIPPPASVYSHCCSSAASGVGSPVSLPRPRTELPCMFRRHQVRRRRRGSCCGQNLLVVRARLVVWRSAASDPARRDCECNTMRLHGLCVRGSFGGALGRTLWVNARSG